MDFTNQATLAYGNRTVVSNLVSGTLLPSLTLLKATSALSYQPGHQVEYHAWIANTSSTAYPQLTLLDNLGRYDFQSLFRFPLGYVDGSAQLNVIDLSGVRAGTVAVDVSTDGMLFQFDVPASSTVWLSYTAVVWPSAPPTLGSTITNTATLTLPAPAAALTASYTLPVAAYMDVRLSKAMCPAEATLGAPMSYTLTLSNYGNTGTSAADSLTLSDLVQPNLTNVSVSADGATWTEGAQYTYNEATGQFTTLPGAFALGAATFAQNAFGQWIATPSALAVTLTGTP